MKDNKLYTNEELELFSIIENQDTPSLSKELFEEEKNFLKETALNTLEKRNHPSSKAILNSSYTSFK